MGINDNELSVSIHHRLTFIPHWLSGVFSISGFSGKSWAPAGLGKYLPVMGKRPLKQSVSGMPPVLVCDVELRWIVQF